MANAGCGLSVRPVCPQSQPVIEQALFEELSRVGIWGRGLAIRFLDTDGVGSELKRRCDTESRIPLRYQVPLYGVRFVVVA